MCRHLTYLGAPVTLRAVIVEPAHGLYTQAWAPRFQQHGTVNADGFGVGWYAAGDPEPARYRRAGPIWADESFADLARVTRSGAIMAAVRDATPGSAAGAAAAAPFASGRWLFSHNGRVDGYPQSAAGLAGTLPAEALLGLEARVDSALLWALVLDRLRRGLAPGEALADTAGLLRAAGVTGRFNFLLTDGDMIAATAAGDTLFCRRTRDAVIVASEPGDEEPGWTEVPAGSLLTATAGDIQVAGLPWNERITIP
jgi:gamma-glutamyl hercynylcysteine S-oxide hydrolase